MFGTVGESNDAPKPVTVKRNGETLNAARPNELLRFGFLSMMEGALGAKHVLVLKHGMSGFAELVSCTEATNDHVYFGLLKLVKNVLASCNNWCPTKERTSRAILSKSCSVLSVLCTTSLPLARRG